MVHAPHGRRPTEPWENNFLLSVWNAVTFLILCAGVKWLCGFLGPGAYATATGNVELGAVFALSALAAGVFGHLGADAFDVPASRRLDAFWFPNVWLALGCFGAAAFVLRALLIGKGFVQSGEIPPKFIAWLFAPSALDWLKSIGS